MSVVSGSELARLKHPIASPIFSKLSYAGAAAEADVLGVGDPLEQPVAAQKPSAASVASRVQVGKVYCNSLRDGKNLNQQFDSCRETSIEDDFETHKAGKGRQYYTVAFRWTNVSKEPVMPSNFGTLLTTDGTEYAAETDISDAITRSARGNDDFSTYNKMNPGTSGRILLCYSIPKGAKVKAIHWGIGAYEQPYPLYALVVK